MDSSGGLFLPWLQPEDSGRYQCHLAAFVGGRNEDFSFELNVSGNSCDFDVHYVSSKFTQGFVYTEGFQNRLSPTSSAFWQLMP